MTLELFLGLLFFAFATAFSPGPNNTLLMATGITFGFRRAIPMVAGVVVGFPLMIACIGFGLGKVFEIYPQIYTAMRYAGAAYMLYLAWKIATAQPDIDGKPQDAKPLSFFQMASFQWVNPKAWIMAVTALSTYTVAASYNADLFFVVLTFFLTGIGSAVSWALFGAALRNILRNPKHFRMVNYALAAFLVLSLIPMFLH